MIYIFGDCALNTGLYALHHAGHSIRLRPKEFQVLTYLLAHRARVVSRQELCEQVWPDQFISDAALESAIRRVRQAIGDSGRAQQLIQTLHGHGYRFIAEVTVCPEAPPGREAEAEPPPLAPGTKPAQDRAAARPPHDHQAILARSALSSPPDDAAQMLPTPDALAGERKMVTILGCALVPGPALGVRLGLDALHSLMRALYALARTEVHRYGGTLQSVAGDRFMALFGVPVAQEDHARRAVLAALGLLQRVAQQVTQGSPGGDPWAVRLGLHTGLVAVGGIGEDAEATAAVVGDTATLAAALQEHAEPGTILVSDPTARLVQAVADVEAVGPMPVGGQPTPVMAYKVLGIRPPRAPIAPPEGRTVRRIIGRNRELATLHALLARVEDGQGHVVGMVGDPGIGKSRLLDEFHRSLTGRRLTYLHGRCLSYGIATPYLPVLDLLRHNCGVTDRDSPEAITAKVRRSLQEVGMAADEWAPYLLQLLGLEAGTDQSTMLSPQTIKARTFESLVHMFVNGSRQRPLVLEVEDLHWIDATSEEWLAALVERVAGVPILVLVSYRPGYRPLWVNKSYATQLTLRRLTPREGQQVLQAVLPTAQVPEALAQEILAKADGNPFFLEELARTVVEQGDRRLPLAVPDTIHAVLAARIDRLPSAEKRLLQAAAVIGKDVTLPLLQALAGLPEEELGPALRHLQAAEFFYEARLVPEPTYTFKHVLTQEVAYQSLLHSTREQYHQQIAQVVEEQFPEIAATQPEWLAHHYTAAGLVAQAIPYWQRAGQHASDRSAHLEAISHVTTGIELLTTLPETPEHTQQAVTLYIALGASLQMAKGQAAPEVEYAYNRARVLCQQVGETPALVPVLFGLWRFYATRSQLHTARELGETLLGLAQQAQDPALSVIAHHTLGFTELSLGALPAAHQHLEEGIARYALDQRCAPVFPIGQDLGLGCRVYATATLCLLGYPDQALARLHDTLESAQELSHPFSLAFARCLAACVSQFRRDVPAVHEHAAAAVALSTEQGFPFWAALGTSLCGWALAMQGQDEEGLVQVRQGIAAWRATGAALNVPYYCTLLAEVADRLGHPEDGLQALAEAHTLIEQHEERWWEAEVCRLRGVLLLRQATTPPAEAETWLQRALDVARRQEAKSLELRAAMSLARLWQQQGKRTDAHALLGPVYSWFTEGFDTADLQEAKALLEELA
jgi:predicted ATPase/class 3 adenylate cyclase/DNA-binding winged helix-turn-helix (wHTH) protein